MAIEPLGSAMSYTVQQTVRPAEAQSGTTESREGQPVEANAPQVDAETISLAKTQTEGDGQKGENGKQQQAQQPPMNNDAIKEALKELAKKETNIQSEFGIHEKTNRITVKLVDKQTKEVIKELPPEKTLDMIAKVWEYAGLLVDEKR
ncbi:MAG: flagellar protein FlaG [Lachnospiraceae bacterium]|nr:flagellar protein FlaG [Lachnospiraceae bacterium]